MKQSKLIGAVTAAVCMVGSALATVTFDPGTGTGFVGKGDVQNAFGWNNAQLLVTSTDAVPTQTDRRRRLSRPAVAQSTDGEDP